MKTAIHFQKVTKTLFGGPLLKIEDLRIFQRETVALYGLTQDYIEVIVKLMTGVYAPDSGSISIYRTDSRELSNEKTWFQFIRNFGIYSSQPVFQEGASIGENLASLYQQKKEPQLSKAVLKLATLVRLTITDLSRRMFEAGPLLRTKVRLSKALAYHPKIVILMDPTSEMPSEIALEFLALIKRARRRQRPSLVIFTSDVWLMEQLADRILFLNPQNGLFVENRLRGWYHKLFPFLNPSAARQIQLSRDILHHSRDPKTTGARMEKS